MQSVFGEDAYPTLEEKVARLLYFVVRNHPFNDGSKRSGAFTFVWFLRKAGLLDPSRISPEAFTALALLFHWWKFVDGPIEGSERNRKLIKESISLLGEIIRFSSISTNPKLYELSVEFTEFPH